MRGVVGIALLVAVVVAVVAVAQRRRVADRAEWAPFFTPAERAAFETAIREHFAAQGVEVRLEDGWVLPAREGAELPGAGDRGGLQNLAQICHRVEQGRWPEVIREHFGAMSRDAELVARLDRDTTDFEEVRPLLAVRLYPDGSLPEGAELIRRTDLEGTMSVIVLDLPSSVVSLKPSQAASWGRSDDELFAIALDNVKRSVSPDLRDLAISDDLHLKVLAGESFYIASRVLDLAAIPGALGAHGSLVAIPHRHMLIVYPIEGPEVLEAINVMLRATTKMEAEGPGSITPNVYWFHDGAFLNLPYRVEPERLVFQPPEAFTEMITGLAGDEADETS